MTQVETLYDWLVQIRNMPEEIALTIDDRVPELTEIPTPQDLWDYVGVRYQEGRSRPPRDPGLLVALFAYFDQFQEYAEALAAEGSVYARVYLEQADRARLKVEGNPRYHHPKVIIHARARRAAAQVLLSHIWEVCYRLDCDREPPPHFIRPIEPEVPYPPVSAHV